MTDARCACLGEGMVEITGRPGAMTIRYGGDVMNTAIYLARVGAPCRFVSALGEDAYSAAMRAMLSDEGIDVSTVARDGARMPGLYIVRTDAAGERSFDYWRSASAARAYFQSGDFLPVLSRVMEEASLLYFSGVTLSLMTEEGVAALCEAAGQWCEAGAELAFDPNYRPAGWAGPDAARRAMEAAGKAATIALPTFEDDVRLFGDGSVEDCAARWRGWGARIAAVKCGADGVYVSSDDFTGFVRPSAPVTPIDTTGAGDSFNAAFMAGLLHGAAPDKAAADGNALAGRVILHEGAIAPKDAILKTV